MNKIEIANECIEKLTTIIQEQHVEIEEMKINTIKYNHLIKLLLVLNLDNEQKTYVCKVFDECSSEEEIIETHKNLLNELK